MPRTLSARRPSLDAFDRAILRIVQRDNKTPQRTIAEAVNLSAAAVQRRIAAMEDAGVIVRNVAIVDTAAVGMAITSIVEVHLAAGCIRGALPNGWQDFDLAIRPFHSPARRLTPAQVSLRGQD